MVDVKFIAPTPIGGTDIQYAQGVRAGPWLFFTGHMASDFAHGLAAEVAGKPSSRSEARRAIAARATSSSIASED